MSEHLKCIKKGFSHVSLLDEFQVFQTRMFLNEKLYRKVTYKEQKHKVKRLK